VRALEHGYFGGVAQTRPSSPASSYKLAPDAKLVDWGQINKLRSDSASVASSSFDFFQQGNASTSSLPAAGNAIRKPSPLHLQPDTKVHNMSSVGGMGGNFLPPPPSPTSLRGPPSLFGEEKASGWVSPLDVHFSRPSTPARPTSFLPKLHFPLEFGKSDLTVPLPDNNGPKSESASIVEPVIVKPPPTVGGRARTPKEIYADFSQQGFAKSPTLSNFSQQGFAKSPTPSTFSHQESKTSTFSTFSSRDEPRAKSPTLSIFPHQKTAPPRPNRLSIKSMFSTEEAPTRIPKEDFSQTFQLPALPLEDLAPRIPPINPSRWNPSSPVRDPFNSQNKRGNTAHHNHEYSLATEEVLDEPEWQLSEKAIIRASVVSKQRVSIIRGRPTQSQDLSTHYHPNLNSNQSHNHNHNQGGNQNRNRDHSTSASSTYSSQTSTHSSSSPPPSPPSKSDHREKGTEEKRTRSQSSSTRAYSRKSRSLSRTRDSIKRKEGQRKFSSSSEEESDSRDEIRDRDGSGEEVQGLGMGFDFNMSIGENPFDNSNRLDPQTTASQFNFETLAPPANRAPPLPARFFPHTQTQDTDRLSINPHGRSTSEVSQNSIGEFYDSYYRQSTQSTMAPSSNITGTRTSVHDRAQLFEDKDRGRRPPPLRLGAGFGGGAGSGLGGITEVATPVASPLVGVGTGGVGVERFPTRI
jgi:hypothetical protein